MEQAGRRPFHGVLRDRILILLDRKEVNLDPQPHPIGNLQLNNTRLHKPREIWIWMYKAAKMRDYVEITLFKNITNIFEHKSYG